ncbi:MAG: prepilin-type N-terminal cleavage/methylation domain-containing protein [Gallionella sp.]|nr:prepilin-type N-terminal cleavage/methylation domain-containing protein [Gallionella sp.]
MKASQGFTLVELMIVVVIIAITSVMAMGSLSHMMANNKVTQTTQTIAQSLRVARARAMELSSDVTVIIDSTSVLTQVQNGATGATRTALPLEVSVSGTAKFVFNSYGMASAAGTISIASATSKKITPRTVVISPLGQVIQ